MLDVEVATFGTWLGEVTVASSAEGVVACTLPGRPRAELLTWVRHAWPMVRVHVAGSWNEAAVEAVRDYLDAERRDLDLPLAMKGTPFQRKVWTTLTRVRYGTTVSYAELARRARRPRAQRACGTAVGSNPFGLFVPSHRVIASDGSLGSYGGAGLELKRKLLELEGAEGPWNAT